MSTAIYVISSMILVAILYKRYFPVVGIPCRDAKKICDDEVILDIRAFNEPGQHHLRIPYAYLKRFKEEIPRQPLHVIANDRLEINLGLRFLLSKGYKVISYEIKNCPCRKER